MAQALTETARDEVEQETGDGLVLANVHLRLDVSGALYWPQERMLIVADLHLEKGSSFAARGVPLPPYDTRATLAVLAQMVERWRPRTLVSLGDSFHDRRGADRLGALEREAIGALGRGRELVWIAGNHDPEPLAGIGGTYARELKVGPLTLRHEPSAGDGAGEVAGHFHPVARLVVRGRGLRRRCFVTDGTRLVMPALGAYAGGLNVRDAALSGLFAKDYDAHLVGGARIYRIAGHACLPDR